jgi:hypothetical protein
VLTSRRAAAVVLAAVVAVSLSGCFENFSRGPMAVKRDGAHMLVAICKDVSVVKVDGDFRGPGTHSKFVTFLRGAGSTDFSRGDTFSTGVALPSMNLSVFTDPDLGPGNELEITITGGSKEEGFSGAFQFKGSGLSSTSWQHPDGSTTSSPCSGVAG